MVRTRTKLDDTALDAQLDMLSKCMQKQQLACADDPYDVNGSPQLAAAMSNVDQACARRPVTRDAEDLADFSFDQFMDMCVSGDTRAEKPRHTSPTQLLASGVCDAKPVATPPVSATQAKLSAAVQTPKSQHRASDPPAAVTTRGTTQVTKRGTARDTTSTIPTSPMYADPICKECHEGVYQADAGFMVCPKCGDMDEACIETGAEWRSFGGADAKLVDPSRCGSSTSNYLMPPNVYSAGTQISSRWRKETEKMHLAQLLQRRLSANPRSRPLRNTFNEFRRATYNSGYSHKIVDEALHLYTSAKHVKNFRADNRVGLLAKCLSESCKKHGVSRSAKEICKDLGIAVDVMTKGHRALTKARKVAEESNHKINEGSKRTRKTVDQPSDFVDRFCCRLKIPTDITEEIRRITVEAKAMRLVSDNAPLVASACILLVVQHHGMTISATDIQKVVSISHVTIDKCYKKLRDFEDALFG